MTNYKLSSSSRRNMKGVHPDLILIFEEALKVSPIDFGVPSDGGVRSSLKQKQLFDQGKSKCDGINTLSKHQIKPGQEYGEAIDFFAFVDGKASWEPCHLALIAGVIMGTAARLRSEGRIKSRLYWGGQFGSSTFQGWDYCHFELIS